MPFYFLQNVFAVTVQLYEPFSELTWTSTGLSGGWAGVKRD